MSSEKELAIEILEAIGDDLPGEIVFKALVIVNAEFMKQQSEPFTVLDLMIDNLKRILPQ
jgi:hypothetical protein